VAGGGGQRYDQTGTVKMELIDLRCRLMITGIHAGTNYEEGLSIISPDNWIIIRPVQ
jgi:hypothetical protein